MGAAWFVGKQELQAYLRERFSPAVFLPLSLLLSLAVELGRKGELSLSSTLTLTLVLLLPLLGLRILDDYHDVELDRLRTPDRVLGRSANPRAYLRISHLLLLCSWIGASLLQSSLVPLLGGLLLTALLHAWYTRLRRKLSSIHAAALCLHCKYPGLVLALSLCSGEGSGSRLAPILPAVLSVTLLYEFLHDTRYRQAAPLLTFCWCLTLLLLLLGLLANLAGVL